MADACRVEVTANWCRKWDRIFQYHPEKR